MTRPAPRPADRRERGQDCERAARAHLERIGLRFRDANYRTRFGELDLVMDDRDALVIVEVRSRRSDRFGSAADSVDVRKRSKVIKAALAYVMEKKMAGRVCRFDVVAVGDSGVVHFRNAFTPPAGRYTL